PTPLAEALLPRLPQNNLALQYLLVGGDRLHRGLEDGTPCRLINHYGPTECAVVTTCSDVTTRGSAAALPPIGRPIANTRTYILDQRLEAVPVGVAGELYIGGEGVSRGYFSRPELTAEKFIPDPFSAVPGARLYRTGDRARWRNDGNLEFLGR